MNLALVSDPNTVNGTAAVKYLLDALGSAPKQIGYIASQPDPAREYYAKTKQMYNSFGDNLDCYLELETEFDEHRLKQLLSCDVIHLSGGDTFRFLHWLKYRNVLPLLKQFMRDGGAMVGVSAGAMIMTPSINTAILCGDINDIGLMDLSGLSLVPFHFVPHVPAVKEPEALKDELQAVQGDFSQVYFCSDDDSLVLNLHEVIELGHPHLWTSND